MGESSDEKDSTWVSDVFRSVVGLGTEAVDADLDVGVEVGWVELFNNELRVEKECLENAVASGFVPLELDGISIGLV